MPVQADEIDRENNVLEKVVYVRESKQIRVLYVEGYRRYEYQLRQDAAGTRGPHQGQQEHQAARLPARRRPAASGSDRRPSSGRCRRPSATPASTTQDDDLWSYDLIIIGDADPDNPNLGNENLKNVAEFVRERGGGLLMLAGERFAPKAYKNTALKDVLPIDLTGDRIAEGDGDEGIVDSYKLELTPVGKMHPALPLRPRREERRDLVQVQGVLLVRRRLRPEAGRRGAGHPPATEGGR